jgi:hypothetical protein
MNKKENIFIFLLFLLFFPMKTQFYNMVFMLIDHSLTQGVISRFYTFNYTGQLLGCLEIVEVEKRLGERSLLFYNLTEYIFFTISLFAGCALLFKTKLKIAKPVLKWGILFVFCFYLADAIVFIVSIPFNGLEYVKHVFEVRWWLPIAYFIMLICASYIFFFTLKREEKMKIIGIVLPASIISALLWFVLIGPKLLPIVIMD